MILKFAFKCACGLESAMRVSSLFFHKYKDLEKMYYRSNPIAIKCSTDDVYENCSTYAVAKHEISPKFTNNSK